MEALASMSADTVGIAEKIAAVVHGKPPSVEVLTSVRAALEADAGVIDEFLWDIHTAIFDYLNADDYIKSETAGENPSSAYESQEDAVAHSAVEAVGKAVLQQAAETALTIASYVNPRESIMLATSRLARCMTPVATVYTLQLLFSGCVATAISTRGISASSLTDAYKAIQACSFTTFQDSLARWDNSDMLAALEALVTTTLALSVLTPTKADKGVTEISVTSLHAAAALLASLRACIRVREATSTHLHHRIISQLIGEPFTIDLFELAQSVFESSTFGTRAVSTLSDLLGSVGWWNGPETVASDKHPQPKEEKEAVDLDIPAEDEDDDFLSEWMFTKESASALRSSVSYFMALGISEPQSCIRFDAPRSAEAAHINVLCIIAETDATGIGWLLPRIFSPVYEIKLLVAPLQQLSAERAAAFQNHHSRKEEHARNDSQPKIWAVLMERVQACLASVTTGTYVAANTKSLLSHSWRQDAGTTGATTNHRPMELFLLQSLLTCGVRDPAPSHRAAAISTTAGFLQCLTGQAVFILSLLLLESCPYPTITAFVIDCARRRTNARGEPRGALTIPQLARIAIMAIDVRLKAGLLIAASAKLMVTSADEDTANYLASYAEADVAILSCLRLVAMAARNGTLPLSDETTPGALAVSRQNIKEFVDLYCRPLIQAVARCEQTLRESAGIMHLEPHPAPFAALHSLATRSARDDTTNASLSKLFILDAALTPTLEILECVLDQK